MVSEQCLGPLSLWLRCGRIQPLAEGLAPHQAGPPLLIFCSPWVSLGSLPCATSEPQAGRPFLANDQLCTTSPAPRGLAPLHTFLTPFAVSKVSVDCRLKEISTKNKLVISSTQLGMIYIWWKLINPSEPFKRQFSLKKEILRGCFWGKVRTDNFNYLVFFSTSLDVSY